MAAKNILGEPQNKNLSFSDVKINKSAGEVIKANSTRFAVPWTTAYVFRNSTFAVAAVRRHVFDILSIDLFIIYEFTSYFMDPP
jgi:hypothetical protein